MTSPLPPEGSHIEMRDPRAMRALANPLRLKLLGLLRRDGAHSVGELSELADAAPGSVSYHLSTLAAHGFVEEAPELARDGRERWWRAAHASTHYEPSELIGNPARRLASVAMRQSFLHAHHAEQLAYLEAEPSLPPEWVKAATAGDTIMHLTPDQLRELSDTVDALAEKWAQHRDPAAEGTAPTRFIYAAFRQP